MLILRGDIMAKRERGEGSISHRKDGKWTGRLFLGRKPDGKQNILAVYGDSEREVKKKLKEAREELIKYDNVNLPKISLSALLRDWLKTVKRHELKPSSYDRLEATIENNIIPYTSYLQLSAITTMDVQRFINELTDKGYSFSTIKKAYNALNAALKYAVEVDYIRKNPCTSVRLPKQIQRQKSDIEYFSEEEVELITKGALYRYKTGRYKYKYGYAIILLLNTGLRVGELLALKWEHVDFDKRQLYICETRGQIKDRTDSNRKYTTASRSTKTESSCRYIPISKKALEALRYLESLGYHSPYVMANADGENGVVSYRNLFRVLSNVLDDSGINHGSLHTLRHTFATRLFKKGVDIKVISELLGHSDISITYNIYTHVIAEQKQKAIDILDEL